MSKNERTAVITAVAMVITAVMELRSINKAEEAKRKLIKIEEGLDHFAFRQAAQKMEERFRNGDFAHRSLDDVQTAFEFEIIVAKLGM